MLFLSDLGVKRSDFSAIYIGQFWSDICPGIKDVFFKEVLSDDVLFIFHVVHVLEEDVGHGVLVHGWVVFNVRIYDEGCELAIFAVLDFVFEDAEDVETGKDSISKVHIVHK